MKSSFTRRVIDGLLYICWDTGCDDFDAARTNRAMVTKKEKIAGYLEIEAAVGRTPLNLPLPTWIPIGVLPPASKEQWNNLSGVPKDEYEAVTEEVMEKG